MAIRIRQGTDSQWENNKSNIVSGEPAITTDTGRFFVGTGTGTYKEFAPIEITNVAWTPTFTWGNSGYSPTVANISCVIDTFGKLCCFRGRFQITALNTPPSGYSLQISTPFETKNSGVGTIGELYPPAESGITERLLIRGIQSGFIVINGPGGANSASVFKTGYYSFGFWWYRY